MSSAIQHAMLPEFAEKWGTECLNARFPSPTLLCAFVWYRIYIEDYLFRKRINLDVAGLEPAPPGNQPGRFPGGAGLNKYFSFLSVELKIK